MRVLLVEDEAFAAERIKKALHSQMTDVVIVFTTRADEALIQALEQPFDCLILDRQVEGGDGVEVLAYLRERNVETPAIIISNFNGLDKRIEGLEAGADDYLGKAFEPEELCARVRSAVRRAATYGHPRIRKFGKLELHKAAEVAEWSGERLKLKPKEFRLLLCLVEAHPDGASYDMIWSRVWGPEFSNLPPQKQVIQTTLTRLRRGMQEIEGFSIVSIGGGYVIEEPKS